VQVGHADIAQADREGLVQLGRERSRPVWHYFFHFLIKSNRLPTSKIRAKFDLSQKSVKQNLVGRSYAVLVIKNMKHMYFMEIIVVIYLILIILVNSLEIHIKFYRTPKIIKFCF
jgi:hypothetical protein